MTARHFLFIPCFAAAPFGRLSAAMSRGICEDSHSFSRSLPLRHYFGSFRKKTLGSFIDTSSNMSSAAITKCSLMHNFPFQWLQLELLLCRAKEKCSRHWKRKVESLMHSNELICTSVETNEKVKCAHKSASRSQFERACEVARDREKSGENGKMQTSLSSDIKVSSGSLHNFPPNTITTETTTLLLKENLTNLLAC